MSPAAYQRAKAMSHSSWTCRPYGKEVSAVSSLESHDSLTLASPWRPRGDYPRQ